MSAPTEAAGRLAPVVIVGGGLAGLFCALKLAPRRAVVIAAAPIGQGASSAWAQGGIASAMGEGDTFEKHLADTLAAGAGIVDEAMAAGMIAEGPDRVHDLLSYGVPFDRDLEGRLNLSREAAHSERRIVRVRGDMAGRAIMEALVARVRQTPSIELCENAVAQDLIVEGGRVTGVRFAHDGHLNELRGAAVVLASGGIGQLYAVTTNPSEACGRGLGMAARAGARIADAEFVQFHPTAIDTGADPAPLATEALRGDGATLIDRAGRRFMFDVHPDGELAPRDIVARAIFRQVASGEGAFLDCRQAVGAEFAQRFPTVYASCMAAGIDPAVEPIPVVPAVHYHMGGVLTDEHGRTSLPGLWACGEVTSTGVHGANRLASNSLLEAVVFAARVAADLPADPGIGTPISRIGAAEEGEGDKAPPALRRVLSRHVGVVRDAQGLAEALLTIGELRAAHGAGAHANATAAALLIAAGAYQRQESRGAHYRTDFPQAEEGWHRRTVMTLAEAEAVLAALRQTRGTSL
ncbi:L-aspartate oxidase [Aureimonas populi]|uniref:L-aspartate oxidase n=1 Tax=Aureimonas populi TaxID=1701758 RepID=A0ABW5CK76_9HYPH|nr:L-aspartate oxidase [Aureimonas populi]